MDIAGLVGDGTFKQLVNRTNDRFAACEIVQPVDILVIDRRRVGQGCKFLHGTLGRPIVEGQTENGVDIIKSRYFADGRTAQGQFDRAQDSDISRVANCQMRLTSLP